MIAGRGDHARLAVELPIFAPTTDWSTSAAARVRSLATPPAWASRYRRRSRARNAARRARRSTKRSLAIAYVAGAAEALPVPDDDATVVWSIATVHHWADLDAGLDEVRRVLAPGGRFVAIERQTTPGAAGPRQPRLDRPAGRGVRDRVSSPTASRMCASNAERRDGRCSPSSAGRSGRTGYRSLPVVRRRCGLRTQPVAMVIEYRCGTQSPLGWHVTVERS